MAGEKSKYFFPVLLMVLCQPVLSQIREPAQPWSVIYNIPACREYYTLPCFDKDSLLFETKTGQRNGNTICRFAKMFTCAISPETGGVWSITPRGKVWRTGITSADAYSLYLTLNSFHLAEGVKLFVYSPGYKDFKGAFTAKNNHPTGILPVAPVKGDSLVLELNIPSTVADYGSLRLAKIFHDYANGFKTLDSFTTAGHLTDQCESDINCEEGRYWQTEKRAVCKLIINDLLCTGTLMANTAKDNTPYILTSFHCIRDTSTALTAIVYFNYESLSCGSEKINEDQSLTGATLIASGYNNLDFALLKLHEVPPGSYRAFYSGWDARESAPENGVSIHHPWGNKKEISFSYYPPKTANFGDGYEPFSTWKISRWDVGTTLPGSSGGPLFNQQHRLTGNLMGGKASCPDPVDEYFTKFNLAWNKYPEPGKQLKTWLNPAGKQTDYMDGYDPYGFDTKSCDTSSNIQKNEKRVIKTNVNGYLSGTNSSGYTQFAEKFIVPGQLLISGFYLHISKSKTAHPLSAITVKIWEGDDLPGKEIYSRLYFLTDLQNDTINYFLTDSILKVSGNFFIGYSLSMVSAADSFAVYHAEKRNVTSPSSMYVFNNRWQSAGDDPFLKYPTALAMGIAGCYGINYKTPATALRAYPNPCKGYINIDIPGNEIIKSIVLFDVAGRKMQFQFKFSEVQHKAYFNLPNGIYYLQIVTNAGMYNTPIIIAGK